MTGMVEEVATVFPPQESEVDDATLWCQLPVISFVKSAPISVPCYDTSMMYIIGLTYIWKIYMQNQWHTTARHPLNQLRSSSPNLASTAVAT